MAYHPDQRWKYLGKTSDFLPPLPTPLNSPTNPSTMNCHSAYNLLSPISRHASLIRMKTNTFIQPNESCFKDSFMEVTVPSGEIEG